MSDQYVTMTEAKTRRFLEDFLRVVDREVRPSRPDEPQLLIAFMDQNGEFLDVRNQIAETKVELVRAQRPGSRTKGKAGELGRRLDALLAKRQEVIAKAAASDAFIDFMREKAREYDRVIELWERGQELAERARGILARQRIPQVVVLGSLTAPALIEVIEKAVHAIPQPGHVALMEDEPLPKGSFFERSSIFAEGLNPKLFSGGSVRLAVGPNSERGLLAEAKGAAVSRGSLVMPLGRDRRPQKEEHWRDFDDILPFAARDVITPVMPACVPSSSVFSDLRLLLSQESWRSIRDAANDRCNGTCVICGMTAGGEVRAEWRYFEPPLNSDHYGLQVLVDVRPYCSSCAGVIFPDPAKLTRLSEPIPGLTDDVSGIRTRVVSMEMRRLYFINRWREGDSPDPLTITVEAVERAYRRRSRFRWALDLSRLHSLNIALNPDMVMHSDGWIMRKVSVPIYMRSKEEVPVTRIFGASFANSDGMRYFFPVPPLHFVPWNTTIEDVWGVAAKAADIPLPAPAADPVDDILDVAGPADPENEDYVVESGPPISVPIA